MILAEVGKAWGRGIVHADLSEFNIMIADAGPSSSIGLKQLTSLTTFARALRERLSNVLRFFERKYKIIMPLERLFVW